MAELVASAFRASATGTLALEEGRGQSRLFLRYGLPCGVSRFEAEQTFGEFLVREGHIDADQHARLVLEVERTKKRYGELAVEEGLLARQVLDGLLSRYCQAEVAQLCLRREGTYELRGWERPPSWTAPVRVDPLRAIAEAMRTEALADRRRAIRAEVGDFALQASADLKDLERRLRFEPVERRLLETLDVARPFDEAGAGLLSPAEKEPLLCALILVGALEPVEKMPAPERTEPVDLPHAAPAEPGGDSRATPIASERAPAASGTGSALEQRDLEDIATALAQVAEEPPGPLSFHDEPTRPQVDLGLLAAEEEAREARIEDDPHAEATAPQEPEPARPITIVTQPVEVAEEAFDVVVEPVGTAAEPLSANGEPEPPEAAEPEPASPVDLPEASDAAEGGEAEKSVPAAARAPASRDDVRRRLLQRAMRNVGGAPFSREDPGATARRPTPLPSDFKAEQLDPLLANEIKERLARPTDDHFARLDLARTATDEDVKESFLKLAKKFHPDRIVAAGQVELLPSARELFGQIKQSYDVLSDPALRARHLATLEASGGRTIQRTAQDAMTAYQKATVFLRKHDFKNAEAELILAVETDPKSEYLAELAWTLFSNPARRADARDQIRDLVARSLKASPVHDRALVVAGFVARADGDLDNAEQRFRQAFAKNPNNVDAAREVRHFNRRKTQGKGGLKDLFRRK